MKHRRGDLVANRDRMVAVATVDPLKATAFGQDYHRGLNFKKKFGSHPKQTLDDAKDLIIKATNYLRMHL